MSGAKYYFDSKGVLSSQTGIDVSYYQGNINWTSVKNAGIDFVMIRVGYRGWGTGKIVLDPKFTEYMNGATAAGLDIGVYFYSQAITVQEAIDEANFVLAAIKGYDLTYPVSFDTEYCDEEYARTNTSGLTDADRTDFVIAFCDTVKDAGYFPNVYTSNSWYYNDLQPSRITGYDIWLAEWTSASKPTFSSEYLMWQYTATGSVSGISGNVDRNVSLFDYPSFIKSGGWNGF